MLKVCNTLNLTQKVTFPTRGENTLDILLSSDTSKIVNVHPAPPIGDHDLVIGDFDFNTKKKPKSQHKIYIWNKADTQGLCNFVSEKIEYQSFNDDNDINDN